MALPSKSFRDPEFRYRRAVETDIRKTFARVRREMAAKQQGAPAQSDVVVPMARRNEK